MDNQKLHVLVQESWSFFTPLVASLYQRAGLSTSEQVEPTKRRMYVRSILFQEAPSLLDYYHVDCCLLNRVPLCHMSSID